VDGSLGRCPVHPIKRNGSAHAPAGTGSLDGCSPTKLLRGSDDLSIEHFSGFQHGMHDDRKLSRYRDRGALKSMRSRSLSPHSRRALFAVLRVRVTQAAS